MSATLLSREDFLPISLNDMRMQLKLMPEAEDEANPDGESPFITQLIKDGRDYCEKLRNEAVTEATYREFIPSPDLEYQPVILNATTIVSFEYKDLAGEWQDLTALVDIIDGSKPTRFSFNKLSDDWVSADKYRITYKAGAATATAVDSVFLTVIRQFVGFFYEHRQALEVPKFILDHLMMDRNYSGAF